MIQGQDGSIYGTTFEAGGFGFPAGGFGTVFRIDDPGIVTLHPFSGLDDGKYATGLIQAIDGSFYGTTAQGGLVGFGTVFHLDGNVLTTVHDFCTGSPDCQGGYLPFSGVIQARDGSLYGTTVAGGANEHGMVFRIDTGFHALHHFDGSDGGSPGEGLIQAWDGNFYGRTVSGGANGVGTVFRIDAAGNLQTIYNFNQSDGFKFTFGSTAEPASLIQASDGSFYGTTNVGGSGDLGVVFRLIVGTPTTTTVTTSLNPSAVGQPVSLSVNVNDAAATGSVEFFDGTTSLGSAALSGGTASLNVSTLTVGSHSLHARYSGDEMFAAGVSSNVTQDVTSITPVNDPPVAQNGTANTFLGTLVIGTLVATDIDSTPLSYAIVSNGTKGTAIVTNSATGAYTYTPTAGASGTDTFTFRAFDGIDDSNIATIAVTIANVPSPRDQIVAILSFFDLSSKSGALVGVPDKSKGKSAKQQLNALRNMLTAARDQIQQPTPASACLQLKDALGKTDGNPKPPDFAAGTAAPQLAQKIGTLLTTLGC